MRLILDLLLTALVAGVVWWAGSRVGGTPGTAAEGAAVLLIVGRVAAGGLAWRSRRRRRRDLTELDGMTGWEFEAYVGELLSRQGWRVELTGASHDLGVDLVAEKGADRLAVQVKRQEAPVSRRAVSDAVAGCHHYDCTGAMVVSNSYFTRGAEALAESSGCALIDRDDLSEWIGKT